MVEYVGRKEVSHIVLQREFEESYGNVGVMDK